MARSTLTAEREARTIPETIPFPHQDRRIMQDFEKLGVFYLGREYDLKKKKTLDNLLLYDSKDLVTHAVCVGMTGSGKTGLCLSLLEEAAIDNIPALVIDPKGDLANLLLMFPDLKGEDFEPWVNTDDARKSGLPVKEFARKQAELWKKGLAEWGQSGERIKMLKNAADLVVYTPGSSAGIAVSILQSFEAPPEELVRDSELFRERINTTVTSLLALLGIDADPIQSHEHILLSTILSAAWKEGRDMDLATLITQIQNPPVKRIGVLDLETFFSAKDRFALSMQFNNLLASPSFEAWMEGVPLDIQSMLYTPEGKPRIAIFSIAHLGDTERMFFVSLFFNQVVAWMRQQSGTTSLRALVYMDEIFGYFPPVKNPPSKTPMLTLLKQARAFGVGLVLATQNPVDIDYKGLSNCGTWFIGRLQTERDKLRVLDGLEGASANTDSKFDRAEMERAISALGNRVFLMHNVHDNHPTVFITRWVLCYLRGPMTRQQIQTLMAPRLPEFASQQVDSRSAKPTTIEHEEHGELSDQRAVLPPEVSQFFVPIRSPRPKGARLLYTPMLLGCGSIYYSDAKADIDLTNAVNMMASVSEGAVAVNWPDAEKVELTDEDLEKSPADGEEGCLFAALPREAAKPKSYDTWKRAFADHLYRNEKITIYKSPSLGQISKPGESIEKFRIRLQQAAREVRDQQAEKLRQKFAPKVKALDERIRKAILAVESKKETAKQGKLAALLSAAGTILGAFLGRKAISATTISKTQTAIKAGAKTMKDSATVGAAEENVEALKKQKEELETEFQRELDSLQITVDPMKEELDEVIIRPKKTNITVRVLALAWVPNWKDPSGKVVAAWE
jgi:hypothetical protein